MGRGEEGRGGGGHDTWLMGSPGSPGVPLEGAGAPRPQCHRAICIQIPSHEYVPAQQVLPGQGKISISTDSRHNALYSVRLWGPCLERLRGGPPGQRGGGRGGGGGGGRALCCILSASCQPCITGDMRTNGLLWSVRVVIIYFAWLPSVFIWITERLDGGENECTTMTGFLTEDNSQ